MGARHSNASTCPVCKQPAATNFFWGLAAYATVVINSKYCSKMAVTVVLTMNYPRFTNVYSLPEQVTRCVVRVLCEYDHDHRYTWLHLVQRY